MLRVRFSSVCRYGCRGLWLLLVCLDSSVRECAVCWQVAIELSWQSPAPRVELCLPVKVGRGGFENSLKHFWPKTHAFFLTPTSYRGSYEFEDYRHRDEV